MITGALREIWRAGPFRSFDIHLANGSVFHVPHSDFLFISPDGGTIVLVDEDAKAHILSPSLIFSATPSTPREISQKAS
jgi:hypothetical protein